MSPRAVLCLLFTPNWGKSLGKDPDPSGNGIRRDVFLVDLLSAHPPTPGADAEGPKQNR